MKKVFGLTASVGVLFLGYMSQAQADGHVYAGFPVTLKGYSGDATTSVSYSGQVARQLLHNGLKKMVSKGSGAGADAMMAYFKGGDNLAILDPVNSDKFPVKQANIDDVSSGKNLNGKTDKRIVKGWPGQMNGVEVLEFMIDKAGQTDGGYDASTGYNYTQLVSKYAMGAVFYNQACDNYLDEKMRPDVKPNDKPYKEGAAYTGKEHSWDEAFGYWGAAAHTLELTAKESYEVAKKKNLAAADYNNDGVVDLKSEMTYAHAYYASSFDKGGKTDYLNTITKAFLDGRKVIADANGEKLGFNGKNAIKKQVGIICSNWEKVIAEAVFKYAGSVYKDMIALNELMDAGENTDKAFAKYAKHWGEAKGFALALQSGPNDLGETADKMNSLLGYGPWLMNSSQIVDIDTSGNYVKDEKDMQGYMLHMLKLQQLMVDSFGITARNNDQLASMNNLVSKLGSSDSAEND